MVADFFMFFSYAAALGGQLFDVITTDRAMSVGWKEENPRAAWVIKKIGIGGLACLKCIVVAQAGPVVMFVVGNRPVGICLALAAGAVGAWAGWQNYKLLKAHKISI